jgi:hypothetical protein
MCRATAVPLLLIGLCLQGPVHAQEVADTVQETPAAAIRDNAPSWENRKVVVTGMMDRRVETRAGSGDAANFFYIRDAYGDALLVRTTAEWPDLRVLYRVQGTVTRDIRGQVFLDEETRRALPMSGVEGFDRFSMEDPTVSRDAIATGSGEIDLPTSVVVVPPLVAGEGTPLWMIGLFALTGALLLAIVYFARKPAPKTATAGSSASQFQASSVGAPPSAATPPAGLAPPMGLPEPSTVIEDRTVKFYAPPPGTVKVLGGRLEVEKPEKNTIRFFSVPSSNGMTEITFGRKPGKPYTHVQIKDPTVSAEQAKILVKDGSYTLENVSKTNPTTVNGAEVPEGGQVLKDGDMLEMGEVSFVFHS